MRLVEGSGDAKATAEAGLLKHIESSLDSSLGSVHLERMVVIPEVVHRLGALNSRGGARAPVVIKRGRLADTIDAKGVCDGGPWGEGAMERDRRSSQVLLVKESERHVKKEREHVKLDFGVAGRDRLRDHATRPDGRSARARGRKGLRNKRHDNNAFLLRGSMRIELEGAKELKKRTRRDS